MPRTVQWAGEERTFTGEPRQPLELKAGVQRKAGQVKKRRQEGCLKVYRRQI